MKRLFFTLLTVLMVSSSFGQGIDVGIKAGANFATLTDLDNSSTRTGLLIGGFVTLKFSKKIALQGDILYSQQGADFDVSEIKLDYLNFPIVLKYYLVKRLNIQAGPQFGSVINDNLNDIGFESFDVSGVVGVGLDLPLGLRVTGRYNFGLTDISFDSFGGASFNTNSKNSVFSLSVGFSFI